MTIELINVKKYKNNRIKIDNKYYDSAIDYIATEEKIISIEVMKYYKSNENVNTEIFCGIDWFEVMYNFKIPICVIQLKLINIGNGN